MVIKSITFTGLTLFALGSLSLSSSTIPSQAPIVPTPTHQTAIHSPYLGEFRNSEEQGRTLGSSTTAAVNPTPATSPSPMSAPIEAPAAPPASTPTPSPIATPPPTQKNEASPTRPVKRSSNEAPVTALPFSAGTVTTSGSTTGPWWLSTIHNPTTTASAPGTIIAVIDTGFALDHSGLAGKWYINSKEVGPTTSEGPAPNCTSQGLPLNKSCNNLDNDGNGYPSDWRGFDFADYDNNPQTGENFPTGSAIEHGTFVSGLIAGTLTSSTGGVDTSARIMPIQALDDNGSGYTTAVADGIIYAADNGAQIINLSLGATSDDQYLHDAITYAIAKGVVVVAAAGNSSCDCMLYPANYPEVIGVGASNMSDSIAYFSSYGANLDLLAPGQDLCSTSWTSTNTTSYYQCGGAGTSFATPIVVGAISRLIESGVVPRLANQYVDITAEKLSAMNGAWRTLQYGTGRLNVSLAVSALSGPHVIATTETLIRNACNGTAACSINLINVAGTTYTVSSKQPTGQAAAVYWNTPSSDPNGTVWLEYDTNTSTTSYYTFN
jgi:hypothetical protein